MRRRPPPFPNPDDLRALVGAAEDALGQAQRTIRDDPKDAVQASVLAAYYAGAAIHLARKQRSAPMLDRAHSVFFKANDLAQAACGIRDPQARYAPNQGDGDIGFEIRDDLMAQAEDCGESGDIECMQGVLRQARKELKRDPELLADVENIVETYFPELTSKNTRALKRRLVR